MSESKRPDPAIQAEPEPERPSASAAGAAGGKTPMKSAVADESAPATQGNASLEEQLAAAKKEAAGNYDHYVRAIADLENFRRRVAREKEELRLFASSSLLQGLLPVLDNLQLGVAAARQQNDPKTIVDGVAMVLEQLKGLLDRHGLKEVNPVGQKFDPHQHEAIAHHPSADIQEEHVMQVVRTGYSLNGRLLRPASVVVSSGPAQKEAS
jgi:molecular chaperone GrpE